jgi:hypothetical protein
MSEQGETGAPARRYTDVEVRLLLERATRTQVPVPGASTARGLTLAELEEVAAEAHIDVARLRTAAHELEIEQASRPAGVVSRLAGGPLRVHVERILPFEVDDTALQRLVMVVGAAAEDDGEPRFVGRTFTWSASTSAGRRTTVRVSVAGGTTSIHVEERYGEFAGGLFGGVLGGVGGGVGIGAGGAAASALGSVALAFAIPAAVIGGSYAACRIGFGAYVRKRARHVNGMCERIVRELTEPRRGRLESGSDTDEHS